MTSKTDKHNRDVEQQNMGFTSRLQDMEYEYEHSVDSYEMVETPNGGHKQQYVFSSEGESEESGKLIVMNIDLGPQRNGVQVLKALNNQRPSFISKEFASKHRLGPKTQ